MIGRRGEGKEIRNQIGMAMNGMGRGCTKSDTLIKGRIERGKGRLVGEGLNVV